MRRPSCLITVKEVRVNDENLAMIDPPSDGGGVDFSTTNGQKECDEALEGRREDKEEEGGDDETKGEERAKKRKRKNRVRDEGR